MLLKALQKEQERHFRPFLCCLVAYIVGRFLALVYEGLVNDPIYFYYRLSMALWSFVLVGDVYALLVVYSNYQELCDLTRLEDFAKEKARSLSIGRSMQDTLNRRSSSSCYSVSARQSQTPQAQSPQSPQTIQSSQTPTGQSLTTQPTRSGSSLSSNTRASLADFSTVSVSSVEAARKQHLQQLYLQQQEYYAEIRRQREQERHQHDHLSDSESPHILHRPIGREQQLSVANLPPIQRQGTPLL